MECGYCTLECTAGIIKEFPVKEINIKNITLISKYDPRIDKIHYQFSKYFHSSDGYEEDLDGLEGFTAWVKVPIKILMIYLTEHLIRVGLMIDHSAICDHWGLVVEIKEGFK